MTDFFTLDSMASGLSVDTLVINLVDPLIDAGDTAQAINATIQTLDDEPIGTFDSDAIFDYRAQRPIVSYADGHLVGVTVPSVRLSLVTDVHGKNFLYLSGQEPDFRWREISETIIDIIERFGVQQVYSFAAMPAPVPHTRPVDMLIRATAGDHPVVEGFAEHYAELSDVFEYMAAEKEIPVVNIRVRVPFYLVRGDSPFFAGALAAIKMLAARGGPTFPLGDLEQLEDNQQKAIAELREEGSDFDALIKKLEHDYDESELGFVTNEEIVPRIPSSDEIGDAVEQFLASQDSSPLDRVQKSKQPPQLGDQYSTDQYAGDLRRIGEDLRRASPAAQESAGEELADDDQAAQPPTGIQSENPEIENNEENEGE
ncbi:hypothetical protein J2S70_001583 [Trueperella bonasi]|uniref:PAC2 family protein n=1 Tax=Trueperella bonasi TaxID=312286 RepID=A0ABT9NHX9_9ACTO|nr:PAC2 family protein [Trueperella bonasi]MDP9807001.1 hypothetical protein [Trueperella bonasi]